MSRSTVIRHLTGINTHYTKTKQIQNFAIRTVKHNDIPKKKQIKRNEAEETNHQEFLSVDHYQEKYLLLLKKNSYDS